jgi:pimeloyl-ACP methyl ester carboxylesterase
MNKSISKRIVVTFFSMNLFTVDYTFIRCQSVTAVLLLLTLFHPPATARAQTDDPMVDAGGYRLHFHVVKGNGLPILFEAGGGDDASTWDSILTPTAKVTGATLITYDRAGFGKSEVAPLDYNIVKEVEGLEIGLAKLGYSGDIMLVAHSLGGAYATLYASRHPDHVKSAVLLDISLPCFNTDAELESMTQDKTQIATLKAKGGGWPSLIANYAANARLIRAIPFPGNIPAIAITSDRTPFDEKSRADRWRTCHYDFAAGLPNIQAMTAYGTGHYIFKDSPELVVAAIAKSYSKAVGGPGGAQVAQRYLDSAPDVINESNRREAASQAGGK